MASALCPHGWPWFAECPFCIGAAPLLAEVNDDGLLLVGHRDWLLDGDVAKANAAAAAGGLTRWSYPFDGAEWVLLNVADPQPAVRLRCVGEAVLFGLPDTGGAQKE